MADRFLTPATRQNTLNEARETRILRDRLAAHEDALDRLGSSARTGRRRPAGRAGL